MESLSSLFRQISPKVQAELKEVYASFSFALIVGTVGAYLDMLWNIGGLLTTLSAVGCCMVWSPEPKRLSVFVALHLLKGASLCPILKLAIDYDPSTLVSQTMGCAIVFGCFSGAVTLTRRREFVYLGGLLSAGVSVYLWFTFASKVFGGDVALFQFQIYFWPLLLLVGGSVAFLHAQIELLAQEEEEEEVELLAQEEEDQCVLHGLYEIMCQISL